MTFISRATTRGCGLAVETAAWETVGDGLSGPLSHGRRGAVWWVDLDPTRGAEIRKTRPAVVLSADGLDPARRTVVVVPLYADPEPNTPIVVETPSGGEAAVAMCDQLRALEKARPTQITCAMSRADLRAVKDGVRTGLQL